MRERNVGGLRCSEVLEDLSNYVDGELPAGKREQIEAHLKECSVCERFGGEFAQMVATVRDAVREAHGVTPDLQRRTISLLRELSTSGG